MFSEISVSCSKNCFFKNEGGKLQRIFCLSCCICCQKFTNVDEIFTEIQIFFRAQAFERALRRDRDRSAGKEDSEKGEAGERASDGTRSNAALSRLVTKGGLARPERARKFVANLGRGI